MTNQHRPTTGDDDQAGDDEAQARLQQQPVGSAREFEIERAPQPGDDTQTKPVIINR